MTTPDPAMKYGERIPYRVGSKLLREKCRESLDRGVSLPHQLIGTQAAVLALKSLLPNKGAFAILLYKHS
jgi:hypothetical protein